MYRVIYASAAIVAFTDPQLDDLLQVSRRNNLAYNITGMLLYKDGNFMQTIEGPAEAVRALVSKVKTDPRHHRFRVLMEGPILQRSFDNWSMGYKKIAPGKSLDLPGYTNTSDLSFMSEQFIQSPFESLRLMLSLKEET